jgi:inositol transport system ATP-binding protein
MDEPTSSLTLTETDALMRVIGELKKSGVSIVFISHRLNEVERCADRVVVLRDGRRVGELARGEIGHDAMIRLMIGRDLKSLYIAPAAPPGAVVLDIADLRTATYPDRTVSLSVRSGEILGLAGLVGSGRSNVAETLFGVTPATSGEILINGQKATIASPADAMKHGMAFLTEDRKETGCFLILDVLENMQIAILNRGFVKAGFVAEGAVEKSCEQMKNALRVKTPDLHERVENLSGGNQQKVLIGRWLLTNPKILILDEPTRGIDVGAKAEIHKLITRLAGDGVAVIMISSEMPEVLGMSDRIMVMHEGRVTGFLDRKEADQVKIMELAAR